jgi:hypothetical protein
VDDLVEYPAPVELPVMPKLYHLVPTESLASVLNSGLLPGLVTEQTLRPYVYLALAPTRDWSTGAEAGNSPLSYHRAGLLPKAFSLIEVTPTDDMELFMWLQYKWSDGTGNYLSSDYKGTLLSSRYVPLETQITFLVAQDRKFLASIPEYARDTDPQDPWTWSSILGCNAPSSGILTANLSWETSEVLTRYVPPSAIRLVSKDL